MMASDAAVRAAEEVLGCEPAVDDNLVRYCAEHHFGWLHDRNTCPRAERVADAVAAIAAREALEDAAGAYEQGLRIDTIPKWLRDRAVTGS